MHRHLSAAFAACILLLPHTAAQATIQADLDEGLSLTRVIDNALEENLQLEEILAELLTNCRLANQPPACDLEKPLRLCEQIREDERAQACDLEAPLEECNPVALEEEYVKLRFSQTAKYDSQSCAAGFSLQSVGLAATNAGMTTETLTLVAIQNNIDPTDILPPAAAGNPEPNIPPPVLRLGGNSGISSGGTASPN